MHGVQAMSFRMALTSSPFDVSAGLGRYTRLPARPNWFGMLAMVVSDKDL